MKKILIVSEYFAPENAIAALRATKFAKYLKKTGDYSITLVSRKLCENDSISEEAKKELAAIDCHLLVSLPEKAAAPKVKGNPAALSGNSVGSAAQPNSLKKQIYSALRKQGKRIRDIQYYIKEKKYVKAAIQMLDELPLDTYDAVFSTYGPCSSHRIGAYIKKKNPEIRWIADFRDHMFSAPLWPLRSAYGKKTLKLVYRNADEITAISQGILDSLENGENWHVLTNGFDPEDSLHLPEAFVPNEKMTFAYCGSMYGGRRDLSAVFCAVKELIEDNVFTEEQICFRYAGTDFFAFQSQATAQGLTECVENVGKLPREDALQLQASADVLLLTSWNCAGNTGVLTGKVFEQMMLEKPILCTITGELPNSALKEMLTNSSAGFCWEEACAEQDTPKLKEYLLSLWNTYYKMGSIHIEQNKEYVARFDYRSLANELSELLGKYWTDAAQ